ncbi:MAG: hypothetical protein WAV96_10945, partial [Trichococcus flocculiformis]
DKENIAFDAEDLLLFFLIIRHFENLLSVISSIPFNSFSAQMSSRVPAPIRPLRMVLPNG